MRAVYHIDVAWQSRAGVADYPSRSESLLSPSKAYTLRYTDPTGMFSEDEIIKYLGMGT